VPNRVVSGRAAGVPRPAADPPDDHLNELRTLLTVSRQHPKDFGDRQIVVRLDDGPKITLVHGQAFTEEIGAGRHKLFAHNTLFWRTIHFAVEPGEHVEFIMINRGTRLTLGLAGLLGAAPLYLTIHRRSIN
jgi:hypothetical protein